MRPDDLTFAQAEALKAQVARHLRWLNRLCDRMNRRGFPPHTPMVQSAHRARSALQDLHVAAHYAAVNSVGSART